MKTPSRLDYSGLLIVACAAVAAAGEPAWVRKSSASGELAPPNGGQQQTCNVVADFDGDGIADFAVGERTESPSVVWYKWNGKGWERRIIDDQRLQPEAGGAALDIDADGDLDLVLGQDASGSTMWWWENPRPDFSKPWTRRSIKTGGARKHHDQTVGDFDGDGRVELVSWNQGAAQLLSFAIPRDPRSAQPWTARVLYQWNGKPELEGFPSTPVDVDGDGRLDLVGGGRWFRLTKTDCDAHVIDDAMRFTQCAAGQLVAGGRPEIVFSPGDMDGQAKWYQWQEGKWVPHVLRPVIHGHTCEIGDIDGDAHLDILIGEMGSPGAGDRARTFVWYGDGRGGFRETVVSEGQGIHEGQLGDFNGDGRLDILMKPYNHRTPRVDVLLNMPPRARTPSAP